MSKEFLVSAAIAALSATAALSASAGGRAVLSKSGRPCAQIVVAKDADKAARFAAAELK